MSPGNWWILWCHHRAWSWGLVAGNSPFEFFSCLDLGPCLPVPSLSPHMNFCILVVLDVSVQFRQLGFISCLARATRVERCLLLAEFPLKSRCAWVVGDPAGLPQGAVPTPQRTSLLPLSSCDSAARPGAAAPHACVFLLLLFTAIMGLRLTTTATGARTNKPVTDRSAPRLHPTQDLEQPKVCFQRNRNIKLQLTVQLRRKLALNLINTANDRMLQFCVVTSEEHRG